MFLRSSSAEAGAGVGGSISCRRCWTNSTNALIETVYVSSGFAVFLSSMVEVEEAGEADMPPASLTKDASFVNRRSLNAATRGGMRVFGEAIDLGEGVVWLMTYG